MTISLSEIYQLYQQQLGLWTNYEKSEQLRELQRNLQLTVKQKQLGLNLEPILANNQEINIWLLELEQLIPGIFQPHKKLYLDRNLTAKLKINQHEHYWLEATVNLGFFKSKPKLLDWRIEQPNLSFQDKVKLWATGKYLKLDPDKLAIVICSFSFSQKLTKITYQWDKEQHKRVERLLKKIVREPLDSSSDNSPKKSMSENTISLYIDSIEEVTI